MLRKATFQASPAFHCARPINVAGRGCSNSRRLLDLREYSKKQHCVCQKGFGVSRNRDKRRSATPFKKGDADWVPVASLSVFQDKQVKAIELKDRSFVTLYNVGGEVYCSDANSTAYKFPLVNAKILQRDLGPAVEVPFDGTIYDLETGKVVLWCPKNNLLRQVLGTIMSRQDQVNLKVYPTFLDEGSGQIYVRFT